MWSFGMSMAKQDEVNEDFPEDLPTKEISLKLFPDTGSLMKFTNELSSQLKPTLDNPLRNPIGNSLKNLINNIHKNIETFSSMVSESSGKSSS